MTTNTHDRLFEKLFSGQSDQLRNDPDSGRYLLDLCSCSLEKIVTEPERLAEEKLMLMQETENLAFSHYKTFIQAANCSKTIYEDFTIIEQRLGSVVATLPNLNARCRDFLNSVQDNARERQAVSSTLSKHNQLLEILEIPQVMDTCVKGGHYEEALELAQYVAKLHRRLPHVIMIQQIAEEVNHYRRQLIEQLLEQLHNSLSLPQCLKIVSFLRQLNVMTEAELRIKFLLSRDAWLQNMLNVVPRDDAYQHITKTMELLRTHLFDLITQYRAVFSDEDTIVAGVREQNVNYPAIFHSWLYQRIGKFLSELEEDIRLGLGGRLDSVLAQTMYFGLSFGRVGADFRGRVRPIFERAIVDEFTHVVQSSTNSLTVAIRTEAILTCNPVPIMSSHADGGDDASQPPMTLLEHPALAIYCNGILNGFNNLRLCLPVSLATRVKNTMNTSLQSVAQCLSNLASSLGTDEKIKDSLHRFSTAFIDILVPYLNKCLLDLFPRKVILELLGLSFATPQAQIDELNQINKTSLYRTLQACLPAVPDTNGKIFLVGDDDEAPPAQQIA